MGFLDSAESKVESGLQLYMNEPVKLGKLHLLNLVCGR